PWEKGSRLAAPVMPLPKVTVGENGEGASWLQDQAKAGYEKAADWYREADGQVQLTEFLQPPSPREFLEDKGKEAAKEVLVAISGPFGKSVEAGIKILDAVKGTTEEIGEILADAPRVIGSGSAADAQELADRANRVPLKFLNSLFNDITGEIDLPEYRYQYKKGWDDRK
ncbi:MAG: hypothetical protein Q7U75_16535, partial [Desulfobacterales bacterium]|nr:hypothetical protein [Desulfobacterales bacterium]